MKKIYFFLLFIICIAGCRDNYELPLRDTDLSLLVVEGVLNAGQGPTTITLSRTLKVNEAATFKPELGAKLSVEGKNGGSFSLNEIGNGNYRNTQLPLVIGQEYRLRIRTIDNKEYLSEYLEAKRTPEIDAVTWKKEGDDVRIYVNTHDPSNNSRYYKWDFDETWEIHSYYTAFFKWVSGTTIVETPAYNNRCWKYAKSNTIHIGSTAQLESDVMNEAPLQYIPYLTERLGVRYSILVKQQTLTKEAYEYFQIMKKNTESIGTIFDPQPSELRGNIKCVTNPEENVIGFLTASTFTEKRLFITAREADWKFVQDCLVTTEVPNNPEALRMWLPGWLPYDAKYNFNGPALYYMAQGHCVDCTRRGGDLNRPSYW